VWRQCVSSTFLPRIYWKSKVLREHYLILVWYQLVLVLAIKKIKKNKIDTTLVLVLAIFKFFDTSLILVLGSNIDFGLVYGKYMLGI